jgi:LPXTG-site transpeptidase (sortase) family protein
MVDEKDEHLGLDNPVFAGRLKQHQPVRTVVAAPRRIYTSTRSTSFDLSAPPTKASKRAMTPVEMTQPKKPAVVTVPVVRPAAVSKPAVPRQAKSKVLVRSGTKHPTYRLHQKKRRGPKTSLVLTALALILFVSGLAVNFSVLSKTNEAQAQVSGLASNGATHNDVPDETPPTDIHNYHVAANMPRFIRINRLGVEARVKRIGTKPNNQLESPGNVFDTGWYDGSSKPGEAGAALIDAHVAGPTKHGVFYDLKKLVAGDDIQIERGDGKLINYRVVNSKSFPADSVDMASTLVSVDSTKPGLNLMTCDGQFDSKTNQYKNRLVVYAVQQ